MPIFRGPGRETTHTLVVWITKAHVNNSCIIEHYLGSRSVSRSICCLPACLLKQHHQLTPDLFIRIRSLWAWALKPCELALSYPNLSKVLSEFCNFFKTTKSQNLRNEHMEFMSSPCHGHALLRYCFAVLPPLYTS